jgi:asparagine synthase (glutamine-hydrolysing)
MCGICGQYRFDGRAIEPAVLDRMTEALAHRGPDDVGTYIGSKIGLGHRRLSVIDPSAAGHQPMANEDGTVQIVFNGEIYNFLELRKTLSSRHRFSSHTDTEVLLHLYEEQGVRCVESLRGMFAFAIWDADRNRLVLARDRVGKKPLFYAIRNGAVTFASELRALLEDKSLTPEIDPVSIHHYLTYQYIPAPLTIFKGIRKVLPAQVLVFEGNRCHASTYWELDYTKKQPARSEEECADALLDCLKEAVSMRLVSDVPLGAFLSGGIDSSSVVALMSRVTGRPVKTFSIGFKEEDHNELAYARTVASAFGTDHQEFIVAPTAVELLPKLVEVFSEPFGDSSAIPTYLLAQASRQSVTVVLTGDGGDEALAGYDHYRFPHYKEILDARLIMPGWQAVRGVIGMIPGELPGLGGLRRVLNRWIPSPEAVYLTRVCYFENEQKDRLYTDDFAHAVNGMDSSLLFQSWFQDIKAADWIDRLLGVSVRSYLPNDLLTKVDLATMAHGLEARCPFLDHKLLEFCATLPARLKLRNGTGKYLLRKAMGPLLPAAVIERKKMGFGVPLRHWFRRELRDYVRETLLAPVALGRGYFLRGSIETLLGDHEQGRYDNSYRLYALLMLELWHRRFAKSPATCPHETVAKGV